MACDFCKDNQAEQDWSGGGAHDFRISDGAILYYDSQFGWEGIDINYCPMCGRELKEVLGMNVFCCEQADKYADGGCMGFGKSEYDDEPVELCLKCKLFDGEKDDERTKNYNP